MENNDQENLSLKIIFVKLLRHWKIFLIAFILSFIPAILYLQFYPRTYEFAASILLLDVKEAGIAGMMGGSDAAGLMKSFGMGGITSSVNVEDEMEILSSNRILRRLVSDLGINIIYSEPYSFYKLYHEAPLILTMDSASRDNLDDEYRFKVSVNPGLIRVAVSTYRSNQHGLYTFQSLPATIKLGAQEFRLDFDNDGALKGPFKLKIKVQPAGWMAQDLGKMIVVEDVSSISNVVTLKYSDHSRQRGIDILNMLYRVYSEDGKLFKQYKDQKTMTFVNGRIDEVLSDLAQVEQMIATFKTKNDMTLMETDVSLYSETYLEIQKAMVDAGVQDYQIKMLDSYVKDPDNKTKVIPTIYSVTLAEKGVFNQYNKALTDRERFLTNSNENNPMVIAANKQIEMLREAVLKAIENAAESSAKSVADLKAKERQLLSKMKAIPSKEREYVNLARNQEIDQAVYLLLLQKKEEMRHALGKPVDTARLIEPPYIMKKTLHPRKLYAAIGILVLTLIGSLGYLFVKNMLIAIRDEYRKG